MPDDMAHTCSLSSINLANIEDMEELAHVTKMTTKMLEYGLHLTRAPADITAKHIKTFRTIGIGIMGLHDFLAKRRMSYKRLDVIAEIAEVIQLSAAQESVELAKRFGSFEAYDTSTWKTGEQTDYFKGNSKNKKQDWENLQKEIDKYGIRHSQLTSPAPTTSTSIFQEASATFLPVYSAFFAESNKSGDLIVAAKYLKENPIGYGKTLIKFEAKEIIDIASAIQQFTDTGISMELLFNHNNPDFKAKDLWDALHYAHEKKIKTIYYIRSVKKNATLERSEDTCVACSA
jgi:ribonucleoside-diphosphate reductase alpha chain